MFFRIVNRLNQAGQDETGGVAAEYGVIIAGIAVVVAVAAAALRLPPFLTVGIGVVGVNFFEEVSQVTPRIDPMIPLSGCSGCVRAHRFVTGVNPGSTEGLGWWVWARPPKRPPELGCS